MLDRPSIKVTVRLIYGSINAAHILVTTLRCSTIGQSPSFRDLLLLEKGSFALTNTSTLPFWACSLSWTIVSFHSLPTPTD